GCRPGGICRPGERRRRRSDRYRGHLPPRGNDPRPGPWVCRRAPDARLATGRDSSRRRPGCARGRGDSRRAGPLPGRGPQTHGDLMPARRCLLLLMGLGLPIPELAAQDTTGGGTKDQARLVFNVNAGYAAGVRGWRVTGQPLIDDAVLDPILIDTLTLARRIRPALTFGVKAIYFAGDHLGVHGEAQLLGLGFEDSCARTTATASARNAAVCSSINNADHSGSAVL